MALIASLIHPRTLEPLPPSDQRREFFRMFTNTEYSPPVTPDLDSTRNIQCPFCVKQNCFNTRFWTESGTGWAQPNFREVCPVCYRAFTKENMGIRKFCDELALKRARRRIFFSYEGVVNPSAPPFDPLVCSETLLDRYTGVENKTAANKRMRRLMKVSLRGSHLIVG